MAGRVTTPHPEDPHTGSDPEPTHPNHYDATDSRERTQGWTSVDGCSGPVSDSDWQNAGKFPDGPGPWKQT